MKTEAKSVPQRCISARFLLRAPKSALDCDFAGCRSAVPGLRGCIPKSRALSNEGCDAALSFRLAVHSLEGGGLEGAVEERESCSVHAVFLRR